MELPTALPLFQMSLLNCNVHGCTRFAKRERLCLFHFSTTFTKVEMSPTRNQMQSTTTSPLPMMSSTIEAPKMDIHSLVSKQVVRKTKDKYCALKGCPKLARIDGFCTKHNMQYSSQKRKCSVEECTAYARTRGLCTRHGGGKSCAVHGCKTVSQTGGMCRAHGGGPRCKFVTCMHFTRVGGLCSQHMSKKDA